MVGAVTTQVSQQSVLAAAAFPAANTNLSQLAALAAAGGVATTQMSQQSVLVAAMGRVYDPVVRAWTFTLDGHDFYVLRLGNTKTLVYDTLADQWYNWGSDTDTLWRAYNGTNWLAADKYAGVYGSNVVVGDDGNGSLYFLNPDRDTDDDALVTGMSRTFERIVMGAQAVKGYHAVPCFGIEVQGSIGDVDDATDLTVTLNMSDDSGDTYTNVGTVSVIDGTRSTRLSWRSLGSMFNPGRLFKLVDYGALRRIDAMDMETNDE